jgi:hypothetical protein
MKTSRATMQLPGCPPCPVLLTDDHDPRKDDRRFFICEMGMGWVASEVFSPPLPEHDAEFMKLERENQDI